MLPSRNKPDMPPAEYLKFLKEQVKRFDRKGLHETCFHEELAKYEKPEEIKDDGE